MSLTRHIAPHVRQELEQAREARLQGRYLEEFKHLEAAHVLGQLSTVWHVHAHVKMAGWALHRCDARELFGQVLRIIGAATKTMFGLVPHGNTGGARVSPFARMPVDPVHAALIDEARGRS